MEGLHYFNNVVVQENQIHIVKYVHILLQTALFGL